MREGEYAQHEEVEGQQQVDVLLAEDLQKEQRYSYNSSIILLNLSLVLKKGRKNAMKVKNRFQE